MDPNQLSALGFVLLPNSAGGDVIGTVESSGTLPEDGRFVIDEQNNAALGWFGGLVRIPLGHYANRIAPLRLYVDGKLVASRDVPYQVVEAPR